MNDNRHTLQWLFDNGRIDLRRGPIFDMDPGPMPASFDFDRVEGMMLGLAIGDSLGNTSERMNPQERRARWGEIRDYLPHPGLGDARGYPSDDTQLAFWTLEQMIADREFDPERAAAAFCSDHVFGIGSAVREFLRNCKDLNKPWYECGPKSAGNGALMRIAPMVIPHLSTGTSRLWADTALSAMLTHNDSGSIAACIAFVHILWQLLRMETPPPAEWWLNSFARVAWELEVDESYKPRCGGFLDYRGPIWRFAQERAGEAYAKGQSALEACNSWHSGAYLLETVPSVIYILMLHGDDPEDAIVRAVNDTRDNDTVAAIVGAAVGAVHGRAKLPERWVSRLSGRTRADDDGRVFELLAEARRLPFAASTLTCSICNGDIGNDPHFARNYPGLVCRRCDLLAVDRGGRAARHSSGTIDEDGVLHIEDSGDNPVFISGVKCWRRYRYGGYVTMRDMFDCKDIMEFYRRQLPHL